MKLISEHLDSIEFITEDDAEGKKNYKIRGVFMEADVKNRNNRMYPMQVLEKEVKRYNKEYVQQKRAFGELGHPDGKQFVGEAKVMDTPYGKIVKNLIDEGAKLGVSSRGMGSLEPRRDMHVVKDDFYLATAADIVADPSAPNAFVEGIMEGKEWVWDNGIVKEVDIAKYRAELRKESKRLEEKKIKLFNEFMSNF